MFELRQDSRYVSNGFKQEVLILCTLQLEQLQIYIEIILVILGSNVIKEQEAWEVQEVLNF